MFANLSKNAARRAISTGLAALAICLCAPQLGGAATTAAPKVPLSDARNVGADSVRFSAGQFSKDQPTLILFGANKSRLEKVKAAVIESASAGYPVKAVFIGPVTEPQGIEIYAKGQLVTKPIDADTFSKAELVKLIHDVTKQFYPK